MTSSISNLDLADLLGRIVLHSLWQLAAVWLFVQAFSSVVPAKYLRTRQGLMTVGLFAMILFPLYTFLLLDIKPGTNHIETNPSIGQNESNASPTSTSVVNSPGRKDLDNVVILEPSPLDSSATSIRSSNRANSFAQLNRLFEIQISSGGVRIIGIGWFAGFIAAMARIAIGLVGLRRLRKKVRPAPDDAVRILNRLKSTHFYRLPVFIAESSLVQVPIVTGLIRPLILIPIGITHGLSPHELEMIIAHELAHVKRYDLWINALLLVLESVFFFHPCVWHLSYQIRIQRELCCDALAARNDQNRKALGSALLKLELAKVRSSRLAAASTAGELLHRVQRLVGTGLPSESRFASFPLSLSALSLGLVAISFAFPSSAITQGQLPQGDQISSTEESAVRIGDAATMLIKGRVVDPNGSPIANAKLSLLYDHRKETVKGVSNGDGEFELILDNQKNDKSVRWLDLTLWVDAEGYNLKCVRPRGNVDDFDDPRIEFCTIKLQPESVIEIHVSSPNGSSEGALVEPYYFFIPNGVYESDASTGLLEPAPPEICAARQVTVNEKGSAKLRGVPAGSLHSVRCWMENMVPQIFEADLRSWGRGTTLRLMPTIDVTGKITGKNEDLIELKPEGRTVFVRTELNLPNNIFGGAILPNQSYLECVLGTNGDFKVHGLMAGSISASLRVLPKDPIQPLPGTKTIMIEGRDTELEIEVVRGISVKGRVLTKDTMEPMSSVRLNIRPDNPILRGFNASSWTREDGSYEFVVPPGSFLIQAFDSTRSKHRNYDYPSNIRVTVDLNDDICNADDLLFVPRDPVRGKLDNP